MTNLELREYDSADRILCDAMLYLFEVTGGPFNVTKDIGDAINILSGIWFRLGSLKDALRPRS